MKKIIFLLLSSALCWNLPAQTLPTLLIDSDAASLGCASATVATGTGAFAMESNVAGLAFPEGKVAAGISYGMWQPKMADDKVLSAGVMWKITSRIAVGAQYKGLSQPSYTITSGNGVASQVNGTFTPKESVIRIGGAFAFAERFSLGAGANIVSSSLAPDAKANVFGVDIGIRYMSDAFQAGLAVNNLGGKVNYGGSGYSQPGVLKAGAAYSFKGLTAGAEADYLFEGGLMAAAGLEYSYRNILSARAGYHYGNEKKAIPSYASLGLGAKLYGISLDAAYLLGSDILGNTLLFTLGYSF